MFWRKSADGVGKPFSQNSLTRVIAIHILQAAVLAVALQTIICFAENFLDEDYFTHWYVKSEVGRLAGSLTVTEHGLHLSHVPEHYSGTHASSYGFRIWDDKGAYVDTVNLPLVERVSPFGVEHRQHLNIWHRRIEGDPGAGSFSVVGGFQRMASGAPVWIEVATLGDPAGKRYVGLWHDFVEDVLVPQVPTVLLTALIALFTVSRALRPVARAAALVAKLEPVVETIQLDTKGMPSEIASFADSINRLLDRYATLVSAQDGFIARAAHQLQTPLAIIMLELGKLEGEEARRIEADIAAMSETVNRLLELARLQSGNDVLRGRVALETVVTTLVNQLNPLAEERGSRIRVVMDDPSSFEGDVISLREAIRNLIFNAIHHTQEGATIVVTCGPGTSVTVDDNGPGLPAGDVSRLFEPFVRGATSASGGGLGLAIVRQVATLHGGRVEAGASPLGGARFRMSFNAEAPRCPGRPIGVATVGASRPA